MRFRCENGLVVLQVKEQANFCGCEGFLIELLQTFPKKKLQKNELQKKKKQKTTAFHFILGAFFQIKAHQAQGRTQRGG